MAEKRKQLRCAIYTRKSSEEGLDQSFNSLDAQRAASEAYVLSQASEGWILLPDHYDDGGFSGGTMERPGLKTLLADIELGKVDVVVVYKIDRLTRSLADFARIVEIFEGADCSFVSVTQAFNTTGSMGKLMLNVLLSFAQFEREVTGERIRDKIAASKKRGMWMGGIPPLGYDIPAEGSRKLQENPGEAQLVTQIFERYLALGSVHALQRELTGQGKVSKSWTTRKGKAMGGLPYSRGALFHLLRNRIYLGQIVHKVEVYDGEHDAIVDQDLFEQVQRHLDRNARRHRATSNKRMVKAQLTGKLFDAAGEPMSPTFSRGKAGRSYRYYVSASLQQGCGETDDDAVRRLPAPALEQVIGETCARWVPEHKQPVAAANSVRIAEQGLLIELRDVAVAQVAARLSGGERLVHGTRRECTILLPLALPIRGGRRRIEPTGKHVARPDPVLIAGLRKAHSMLELERGSPTIAAAPVSQYDRKILRLAFLAPDIQRAILEGTQPRDLTLERLKKMTIPLAWPKQHEVLGFPATAVPCSGD